MKPGNVSSISCGAMKRAASVTRRWPASGISRSKRRREQRCSNGSSLTRRRWPNAGSQTVGAAGERKDERMAHTEFYVEVFYILSVLLSLVFAPVIFILWRNARILREKKWAAPFANTFFVLAAIYSLLLANLIITVHASGTRWEILSHLLMPIIATGSGLTNFLFLLSAYHLAEPALDNQRLPPFTERMVGQARVKWAVLIILLLAGLIQLGADKDFVGDWASGWFTVPDAIFSTLALLSMGVVLYRNIRFRHDPFMARLALVSSIGYAIIYVLFVLGIIQKV